MLLVKPACAGSCLSLWPSKPPEPGRTPCGGIQHCTATANTNCNFTKQLHGACAGLPMDLLRLHWRHAVGVRPPRLRWDTWHSFTADQLHVYIHNFNPLMNPAMSRRGQRAGPGHRNAGVSNPLVVRVGAISAVLVGVAQPRERAKRPLGSMAITQKLQCCCVPLGFLLRGGRRAC